MSEPSSCAAHRLHILKTISCSPGRHCTSVNLGVHWLHVFLPLASIFVKYLIQVPCSSVASRGPGHSCCQNYQQERGCCQTRYDRTYLTKLLSACCCTRKFSFLITLKYCDLALLPAESLKCLHFRTPKS